MQARVKTATHEEGDMCGGKREKYMYFLFFLYFSFGLQAEIFTPAREFRSLNHLRGKWRTSESYGMKSLSINEEELAEA